MLTACVLVVVKLTHWTAPPRFPVLPYLRREEEKITGCMGLSTNLFLLVIRASAWTCSMESSVGCVLWSVGGGRAQL